MAGGSIDDVSIVDEYFFPDIERSVFTQDDRRRILGDMGDLKEDLVTWGRPLTKCVKILKGTGDVTIYRRRVGDSRVYFIRDGNVLRCIGVGKRKNTYDRDLDTIVDRAKSILK